MKKVTKPTYEATIGIEVHVQLKTKSKMFCACKNADTDAAKPNTHICPICLGHPGTLPVLNKKALEFGIIASHALEAEVQPLSKFDSKHYFYPDLPKGYQISQYDEPLALGGHVTLYRPGADDVIVHITRLHLEEDAAKLMHTASGDTLIDFNRGGTPLAEIVSEPDMHTPQEAKEFVQELRQLLVYTHVTDGNLKKGHMRFDANVSLLPASAGKTKGKGAKKLGQRVEIKNINSFSGLEAALTFEIKRQARLLENGETVTHETRGWDDAKKQTYSQRSKETSADYRYFPEPDLPPLELDEKHVQHLKTHLPELPAARRTRFMEEYTLSYADAKMLADNADMGEFFGATISELRSWLNSLENSEGSDDEIWQASGKKLTRLVLGWITTELVKLMNAADMDWRALKITPENFAEFIALIYENKVNSSAAQGILADMFTTGIDPSQAMAEKNLEQVSDVDALGAAVDEVVAEESGPVEQYRAGKTNVLMYLVGKVMKKMKGKANPQMVTDILRKKLG